MIKLNLYDHEVDLVKRALIEFRDAARARTSGEFRHTPELCSAEARNADRANEVFERLLYSGRTPQCRPPHSEPDGDHEGNFALATLGIVVVLAGKGA